MLSCLFEAELSALLDEASVAADDTSAFDEESSFLSDAPDEPFFISVTVEPSFFIYFFNRSFFLASTLHETYPLETSAFPSVVR